ncbi:hypothetical protein, partial [Chromobacterium piscinae]|uniref:hypothetical protein n=1 Tax=Chromobacterium piscinae TaxID=686831 RepID=UPI0032601E1D
VTTERLREEFNARTTSRGTSERAGGLTRASGGSWAIFKSELYLFSQAWLAAQLKLLCLITGGWTFGCE